jgi:hypothetical protein
MHLSLSNGNLVAITKVKIILAVIDFECIIAMHYAWQRIKLANMECTQAKISNIIVIYCGATSLHTTHYGIEKLLL